MPHQWTEQDADAALARADAIVSIGQVAAPLARILDRRVRAGELVKYRGHWTTLSPHFGMGPLKTIWARPDVARAAGVSSALQ